MSCSAYTNPSVHLREKYVTKAGLLLTVIYLLVHKGQTKTKNMKGGKGSGSPRILCSLFRDNLNLICPLTQCLPLFLMYCEKRKMCGKLVQNSFHILGDSGTEVKRVTTQWSVFKDSFTQLGKWNHFFPGIVFTFLGAGKIDHKFHLHFCSTPSDAQNKTQAF